MSQFITELLTKAHDRDSFDCGVVALNHYLRNQAGQDVKRRAAAVFVLTESMAPERVIGYYSLSASSVHLQAVPELTRKRFALYPDVPAVLIGRLARDKGFPGMGQKLLLDALNRSLVHADEIAVTVIVVDAKDESAQRFYSKYGFLKLLNKPKRMFIPMKIVERLFCL